MRKKDIERSLNRSLSQLPLPGFEQIQAAPVEKMAEHDFITRQELPSPSRSRPFSAVCACALLLLVFSLGWAMQYGTVYSVITLDVNPSIEITANRQEQVLAVRGINQDAAQLLTPQKYRNQKLQQVVADLTEVLAENHFLSLEKNTILLSIQAKDGAKIPGLEERLSGSIRLALEQHSIHPHLLYQAVTPTPQLQDIARQHDISPGRLQFIYAILQDESDHTLDQLAAMTMEQLADLLEEEDDAPEKDEPEEEGEEDKAEDEDFEEALKPWEEEEEPDHGASQAEKDDPKEESSSSEESEEDPEEDREPDDSQTEKPDPDENESDGEEEPDD